MVIENQRPKRFQNQVCRKKMNKWSFKMSFNKDFLKMYSPVSDPCFCTSQNKKRTVGNFSTSNILVQNLELRDLQNFEKFKIVQLL